jgi:amino acid transporter
MGSMFPTSGGQYFWVSILAPRSSRRYLSYITGMFFSGCSSPAYSLGWLCAITWQTGLAGSAYFAGTIIQGLIVLNQPDYVFQRWHGTLLTLLFIVVALLFNTLLARRLPMVEGIFVLFHVLGVFIFLPLWILAPRRDAGSPLVDFFNGGGWSSNGLATMVGATGPIGALIGFDCSVHMGTLLRLATFHI